MIYYITAGVLATTIYLLRRRKANSTVSTLSDLSNFTQEEILMEGDLTVILGRFSWQPAEERALLKLSVKPIAPPLGSLESKLASYSGAEYAYYTCRTALLSLIGAPGLRPAFNLEVIAPASEKQIARSRPQPGVLIEETPQLYRDAVKPYIDGMDPRSISWIGNVLNMSKERERVLFNDPNKEDGFLLNIDTKWKSHPDPNLAVGDEAVKATWKGHKAVRDLYCLAICHRTDVKSLRDLTAAHLPLLKRILKVGTETVCETYGVNADELRVFVHYQPQFYHFHVHFTRLHNDLGCQVERAHLLADIINNLEADSACYASKRTLYYQLKANDKLLAAIREHQAAAAPAAPAARRKKSPARR